MNEDRERELKALRGAAPDLSPESRSVPRAAARGLTFILGFGCLSALVAFAVIAAGVLCTW